MDYTRLSMIMLALVNLKKHSLMHCTQPVLPFVNNMELLSLLCLSNMLNLHTLSEYSFFFVSLSQIKYIYLLVFFKE